MLTRFVGNALAVAQVDTLTLGGTIEVGDRFLVTINGKTFVHSAGTTVAATEAAALAAAWNALSSTLYPEFAEITAAATSGGALTLTADTAGKPFTVTVATTEANGSAADAQTFGRSATIASSGPRHWDTAANWSGGSVPANSDDVHIDQGGDILYGLDQSAVTLASLHIAQSWTGRLGLPRTNTDGSANYPEYRSQFLAIGATSVAIGNGSGAGSGRIKLNTGSVQTTLTLRNSGSPLETGLAAVIWKGTHASNAVHVLKGSLDVAPFPGETATLVTLNVGYRDSVQSDSQVTLGTGVTLTDAAITQSGGSLTIQSATSGTATLSVLDGVCTIQSGGHVGLAVRGGTCVYNSTGTLGGNAIVSGPGHLDFSQDLQAKTVTNAIELYGEQARLSDPHKVVSSLVIDCNETVNTTNVKLGRNVRLTRASVS